MNDKHKKLIKELTEISVQISKSLIGYDDKEDFDNNETDKKKISNYYSLLLKQQELNNKLIKIK